MYQVTKLFDGLSCCFRQWRADSHCKYLHGYALQFKITFECKNLDDKNWVTDFGGMKGIRERIEHMFDHTIVIAIDDPEKNQMYDLQCSDPRIMDAVGCEKFAEYVYNVAATTLTDTLRVWIKSVECIENGKNSAIYVP